MARPPNDLGNAPLTPEQAWAGKLAMAARDQAAADVKQFLKAHELKKFCIEKAIEDKGDTVNLMREFYKFLTEE